MTLMLLYFFQMPILVDGNSSQDSSSNNTKASGR